MFPMYQSSSNIEVFTPQCKDAISMFKISHPNNVSKIYEKSVKGYVINLEGNTQTKLQMPKEDKKKMNLTQPFLVIQCFVPVDGNAFLELSILDGAKTRRRLIFSTAFRELVVNPLHAQIPLALLKRNVWSFKSLESFTLGTVILIRKIFTMKAPLTENNDSEFQTQACELVPRAYEFPLGVDQINQGLRYSMFETETTVSSISKSDKLEKNELDKKSVDRSASSNFEISGFQLKSSISGKNSISVNRVSPGKAASKKEFGNSNDSGNSNRFTSTKQEKNKGLLNFEQSKFDSKKPASNISALHSRLDSASNDSRRHIKQPKIQQYDLSDDLVNVDEESVVDTDAEIIRRKEKLAALEESYRNNFGDYDADSYVYGDGSNCEDAENADQNCDAILFNESDSVNDQGFSLDLISRPMSSRTLSSFQKDFENEDDDLEKIEPIHKQSQYNNFYPIRNTPFEEKIKSVHNGKNVLSPSENLSKVTMKPRGNLVFAATSNAKNSTTTPTQRPFTPPFIPALASEEVPQLPKEAAINLLYDPILQCYFDPQSQQYFDFK